jgi:fused signal recognition particle receptor
LDPLLYVAIGAVALVIVYFLFIKKKDDGAKLDEGASPPAKLPAKPERAETAPKKEDKKKTEAPAKEAAKADKAAKTAEPAPAKTTPAKSAPPAAATSTDSESEGDDAESPAAAAKASAAPPKPERSSATPSAPLPKRAKDVAGLRKGLAKSRESGGFFGRLRALFTGKKEIDPQIVEQLEEVLLTSDVGVRTTERLLEGVKERLGKNELSDDDAVWAELRNQATKILDIGGGALSLPDKPTVVFVVGVNGVGKTTTIGKLATRLKQQGKTVVLAAGDTFRAAAVQQLEVWATRVGCEIVKGKDGANPGAVIFDAIARAKEIGADVVLADTAGRLHTKSNLMEELKKVHRTLAKAMEGAPHETLLVLDATNGQNALQQAALFKEALPLTGLVLTKLDGTAKGGVVLGVCAEHELPVRYIGVGERAEDLRDFDASEFVEALLGTADGGAAEAA